MQYSWIALIALPAMTATAVSSGGSVHIARPLGVSLLQKKGLRASAEASQRAPEGESQETDDQDDQDDTSKKDDQDDTSKKDDQDDTSKKDDQDDTSKKDDQDETSTSEVAKFGPSDCFTTWRNKDGQCEIQTKCNDLDIDTYLVKIICVEEDGEMVRHVFGTGSFDRKEQFNTLIKCEHCLADRDTDVGNVADTLQQLLTEVKELKDSVKSAVGRVEKLDDKVFSTRTTTTTTTTTTLAPENTPPSLLVHVKQAHRRATTVLHMRTQKNTGSMATAESVAEEKAVGAVTGRQHPRHFMVSLTETAHRLRRKDGAHSRAQVATRRVGNSRDQGLRSRHVRPAPRQEAGADRDGESFDYSTPEAAAGIAFSTGEADRTREAQVRDVDVDSAAQETDIVQDGEAEAQAGSEEESAGADSAEGAQDGEAQQDIDEQQGSGDQQDPNEQQADNSDKQADVVDEQPAEDEEDSGLSEAVQDQ